MFDKAKLGRRIKKVRENKHLTLKNIEAAAGISATHISEIERGKTSPTLRALIRIAEAMGKDPAYFVESEDLGETSLITLENRIQESMPGVAGTLERLTSSIPGGRLQGCIVNLEAGGDTPWQPATHDGNEAALVLAGRVVLAYGEDRHELAEGDSVFYGGLDPHSYANAAPAGTATIIWMCTERGVI
ncbi:MAG: helix-turn-helix domain-containing protein [Candidatus Krumholzibacteriia bacterium]